MRPVAVMVAARSSLGNSSLLVVLASTCGYAATPAVAICAFFLLLILPESVGVTREYLKHSLEQRRARQP